MDGKLLTKSRANVLSRYRTSRRATSVLVPAQAVACKGDLQIYIHATPTDRTRLAAAVHLGIRTSTYKLHQQQDKVSSSRTSRYSHVYLQPYTNKQDKVSSSRTSWYSHVYLQTTPTDRTRLAAAVHLGIRTSTYFLHQ